MTEELRLGFNLNDLMNQWLEQCHAKDDYALRELICELLQTGNMQVCPEALSLEKMNSVGKVWALCIDVDEHKVYFPALVTEVCSKENSFIIACQTDKVTIQYTSNGERKYHFKKLNEEDELIQEVWKVADLLFLSLQKKDALSEMYQSNTFQSLLILFLKLIDQEDSKNDAKHLKKRNHFYKLIHLISTKFADHLTVKDLSNELDLSVQYLNRLSGLFFGLSLRKYLVNSRLEASRIMLEHRDEMIKEIAARCGFKEPDNFIKTFREAYLITPKKFRDQIQAKQITSHEKVNLHKTVGFVEIEPVEDEKERVSAIESEQQYIHILANALDETVYCKWLDVFGVAHAQCELKANVRFIAGSSKNQCWIIEDADGNCITAYKTIAEPSIMIIQAGHDERCMK